MLPIPKTLNDNTAAEASAAKSYFETRRALCSVKPLASFPLVIMFATSAVTLIHKVTAFSVLTSWPLINTCASFPLHMGEAQTELARLVSRYTKAVWGRGANEVVISRWGLSSRHLP